MKQNNIILLSIFLGVIGFIFNAIAWSTIIKHPYNSMCLILGLGLSFLAFVLLIYSLVKK
ncbi:hypothetical protein CLU82_1945 [Flavobacterium sp. 5]|nr:hypothetical protein CLU82_1945 [Flavobacterium sp. 5]